MLFFKLLIQIILRPKEFFSENLSEYGWQFSTLCLAVSSVIFTCADILTHNYANLFIVGSILFVNAFGMVLISSSIGYMIMTMTIGKNVSFSRFYSVYALSSGAALLLLWVPYSFVIIEIWRWWLIGNGLINGCDLKKRQAFWVIAASIVVMVGFFMGMMAVISQMGTIPQ